MEVIEGPNGHRLEIMTAAELLAMEFPTPQHGHHWGPWRYDAERLVLVYDDPAGEEAYEIDLEECRDSAEVLARILPLSQKAWMAREAVGHLVQAFDDLLDPQANLCSFGRSRRLHVKRWLAQR
jgi:hypothetical protein